MRSAQPDPGLSARCADAARRLRSAGLGEARVSPQGANGEIAAVRLSGAVDAAALERLDALEPEIREIGFRYVALDLGDTDDAHARR